MTYTDQRTINSCDGLSSVTSSPLAAVCVEDTGCALVGDVVLCRPPGVFHEVCSPEGGAVFRAFFAQFV
jgi:hypothetical protein